VQPGVIEAANRWGMTLQCRIKAAAGRSGGGLAAGWRISRCGMQGGWGKRQDPRRRNGYGGQGEGVKREGKKSKERRGRTGPGADTEASRMSQNNDDVSGML
jgi:hypothetical protein